MPFCTLVTEHAAVRKSALLEDSLAAAIKGGEEEVSFASALISLCNYQATTMLPVHRVILIT